MDYRAFFQEGAVWTIASLALSLVLVLGAGPETPWLGTGRGLRVGNRLLAIISADIGKLVLCILGIKKSNEVTNRYLGAAMIGIIIINIVRLFPIYNQSMYKWLCQFLVMLGPKFCAS